MESGIKVIGRMGSSTGRESKRRRTEQREMDNGIMGIGYGGIRVIKRSLTGINNKKY
jgi:hypothetical protein